MTDLKTYLDRHGAAHELARKSGLTPATISKLRNGKSGVSVATAVAIEKGSDGVLRAETLVATDADRNAITYLRGRA